MKQNGISVLTAYMQSAFLIPFRIIDKILADRITKIGNQPYTVEAPLLYIYVIDNHRNLRIAKEHGISKEQAVAFL